MTDRLFDSPVPEPEHIALVPGVTLLRLRGCELVIVFEEAIQVDGNIRWYGSVVEGGGMCIGQTFSAPSGRWERYDAD